MGCQCSEKVVMALQGLHNSCDACLVCFGFFHGWHRLVVQYFYDSCYDRMKLERIILIIIFVFLFTR
jgi:hypothetical protein